MVGVNALQGTLGSFQDMRFAEDAMIAIGREDPHHVPVDFPLARDLASWILLFTIVAGAVLLHKQWTLMSTCLSRLAESGALMARDAVTREAADGTQVLDARRTFRLTLFSKVMGVDRMIMGCTVDTALPTMVEKVNRFLEKRRLLLFISTGGIAFILGGLLGLGQKHSLFVTFSPRFESHEDPSVALRMWLEDSYAGWWAGDSHVAGYLLYAAFAVFAFFIILSFNTVGYVALYLAVALRYVSKPGADWFNRDGRYGWRPLAEVYLTVLSGVALLGLALTVTLAVLGIRNFAWVGIVVVVYILVAPAFVFAPRLLFRHAARRAKVDRVYALAGTVNRNDLDDPARHPGAVAVVAEIERCRNARIQPLRLRKASASTFLAFFVLPILLAAAQVFFPWITGS